MITDIIIVCAICSFFFFLVSKYFKEKLEKNVFVNPENNRVYRPIGDNIYYTALSTIFFNLFILFIPITLNISWIILDEFYTGSELITMFELFTLLGWFLYVVFIGLNVLVFAVKALESMGKIGDRGKDNGD